MIHFKPGIPVVLTYVKRYWRFDIKVSQRPFIGMISAKMPTYQQWNISDTSKSKYMAWTLNKDDLKIYNINRLDVFITLSMPYVKLSFVFESKWE